MQERVREGIVCGTPFPVTRNYLVAKMKTSRGLSLTRDGIIGTDGGTETLALSNCHFEPLPLHPL